MRRSSSSSPSSLTVLVPYFYKWATDALDGANTAPSGCRWSLTGAITLVVAYNIARIISVGLNQLRDALFARVGQHAVRQLAYRTFVHMHRLSLRFHLERRTGGLSRIIERGTKGIETIVRFTILNYAADDPRVRARRADLRLRVRPGLSRGHRRDGLALCLVHDPGQRLADHDPPRHERLRHRRQHQGDRTRCSTSRR